MIYKGTQKKMIMLRDTGSNYFEEAYFIIKDNIARSEKVSETDMIKEANRIVGETVFRGTYGQPHQRKKGNAIRKVFWYAAGVLSGIGLSFITVLLIK